MKTNRLLILSWFIILAFHFNLLSKVDGYFFPVVGKFTYEYVKITEDNDLVTAGFYTKYRNCSYVGMQASFRENGLTVPVRIVTSGTTTARLSGTHSFGPWTINITKDQFNKLDIYVIHSCNGLWNTWTKIKSGN